MSGVNPKQFPIPPPASRNIWFLDEEKRCWCEGEILNTVCNDRNSKLGTWTFFITTSDGKTTSVRSNSLSYNEFDFKHVKNRSSGGCVKDLDSLVFVNEPEILKFLSTKFKEKQYYHRTGDVTLSMNPCEDVAVDCERYVDKSPFFHLGCTGRGEAHPYEAAEAVFASLVADKYNLDKRMNQTIFVRGCSGSGKTENMKLILQFLLSISVRVLQEALDTGKLLLQGPRIRSLKSKGASSKTMTFDSSLEGRFAAVNNILESLGNACRPENHNASRFARLVELQYAADCYIEDMSVDVFLLETERVHVQNKHERNFHVFYELAAGASDEFKAECGIQDLTDFHYINQGGVFERQDNVSDEDGFKAFCHALNTLKVSLNDQEDFLKCIAGILHLGNVTFDISPDGKAQFQQSPKNNHHIDFTCSLFMISRDCLQGALLTNSIGEDVHAAVVTRNHLAKTFYQLLVQWILRQYKGLRESDTGKAQSCSSKITIVDIFAHERSKSNSFMQFCINYCGEHIHDHFVAIFFEKEQERYLDEGIEWNFVAYNCNREAIKMLEKPESGFFDILESEANMPNPCDKKLMHKCYSKIKSPCFYSSNKEQKGHKFVVMHYCGAVTYDSHGFIEKNKLTRVTPEILNLLNDSSSPLVASLADEEGDEVDKQDHRHIFLSARIKATSTLLKRRLDNLTKNANKTQQHWLLAFKTSHGRNKGDFDDAFVLDQVIESGLVPLVSLNQKGFAYKLSFQEFVCKFYDLVLLAGKCEITADFLQARQDRDWQTAAIYLLGFVHITKEILVQMGIDIGEVSCKNEVKTELNIQQSVVYAQHSVFIKRAMYEHLELLSFSIRIIMAVKIQRHFRMRFLYRKMDNASKNVISITSNSLAYFANVKFCKILKETNARITLQRFARIGLIYLRMKRRNYLIVRVQARIRGHFVRRDLMARQNYAVSLVQMRWKRMVTHKKFIRRWSSAVNIQRCWRNHQQKLHALLCEQTAIKIQRRWRSTRKAHRELKRLKTVDLHDESKQRAVKEEFLATLDAKLDKDPLYLIHLLQKEDEVVRLTRRVEEVKKLTLKRCQDLSATTSKLEESKRRNKKLQATIESNQKKVTSGSSGREKKELLQVIGQLQKWIAEKEISRVKSLEELANTEAKVTSMLFDTAHHKQSVADIESQLTKKTEEFKDYEFSLVKTSKNAAKVEYDIQHMKFEIKKLQDKREYLNTIAIKDMKTLDALQAFCTVLNNRIQSNSPEIQLAELNFGLQTLRDGVTKLFSKTNEKERLKAVDNEANLAKAQKKVAQRMISVMKNEQHGKSPAISFRHFTVDPPSSQGEVLPKYGSFQQVGRTVAEQTRQARKSKVKNLAPPDNSVGHAWKSKFLSTPTWCMICKKFIQGLTINQQHAFKCRNCKVIGHRDCCHDFKCQCGLLVFDHDDDVLVPVNKNDHLWMSKLASVEDKCDLCDKYISDTLPGKSPFECRRCKVFGHRDCCAKFSCETCGSQDVAKRASGSYPTVGTALSNQLNNLVDKLTVVPTLEMNSHKFKMKYLSKPTWCCYCKKFIVGLTSKQQDAVKCTLCKESCHRRCAIEFNEGNEAKRRVCPQVPVKSTK